jgi:hypothetical protein
MPEKPWKKKKEAEGERLPLGAGARFTPRKVKFGLTKEEAATLAAIRGHSEKMREAIETAAERLKRKARSGGL